MKEAVPPCISSELKSSHTRLFSLRCNVLQPASFHWGNYHHFTDQVICQDLECLLQGLIIAVNNRLKPSSDAGRVTEKSLHNVSRTLKTSTRQQKFADWPMMKGGGDVNDKSPFVPFEISSPGLLGP
jgi:hypothetical protein